ncbi:hypothetical protein LTR78_001750 [Recurvomyces mirabilis]|uniref:Uncharacterized protein n=1 Tax=Recurvomyces mirabilis TaxID=574656 RepID=A0AAE1C544_9PEZI|nr:hypothetical protein LTR78_001750 [Recurvomyces mirabilis]KAK5150175.1 hypothetical protein LTS14_010304 [Recurvomyces mirabilis]
MASYMQILQRLNAVVEEQHRKEFRVTELEGVIATSRAELAVAKDAVEEFQQECLKLTQALHTSIGGRTNTQAEGQLRNNHALPERDASTPALAVATKTEPKSSRTSDTHSQGHWRPTAMFGFGNNSDVHVVDTEDIQDKKRKTPQFSCPEMIHDRFQCVVRLDGVWTAISCNQCDTNASNRSGRFLRGINGLHLHVAQVHCLPDGPKQTKKETQALCHKRAISDQDATLMANGDDPVDVAIDMVWMVVGGHVVRLSSKTVDSGVSESAKKGTDTTACDTATRLRATTTLPTSSESGIQVTEANKRRHSDDANTGVSGWNFEGGVERKRRYASMAPRLGRHSAVYHDTRYDSDEDDEES